MSILEKLRRIVLAHKQDAASQRPRRFLPADSLNQILQDFDIIETLRDSLFDIRPHKLESTADFVSNEGTKVFAILIELGLERSLTKFIEYGIGDGALPILGKQLEPILGSHGERFVHCQWDYLAYTISKREYSRRLSTECILPYVGQKKLSATGFSVVYDVLVHPAHQDIDPGVGGTVRVLSL